MGGEAAKDWIRRAPSEGFVIRGFMSSGDLIRIGFEGSQGRTSGCGLAWTGAAAED